MAARHHWEPARPDLELDDATRELLLAFRTHLMSRGLAAGTIRLRVDHVAALAASCGPLGGITVAQLEDQLARRSRTNAAESRKSRRSSWRVFYRWAVRAGLLAEDPTEWLDPVFVPRRSGRIASDRQVRDALVFATLPEKAMILLGRYAGLRRAEITCLHTDDREGDTLRVIGKGSKQRSVPVNAQLAAILDRLEATQGPGYYFPGRYGGHMHPQAVGKIITRRLGANPHSLRHAAATAAYHGTGNLRAVQELLGHASLATTQRYLHTGWDEIRAAADATSLDGLDTIYATPIERAGTTVAHPRKEEYLMAITVPDLEGGWVDAADAADMLEPPDDTPAAARYLARRDNWRTRHDEGETLYYAPDVQATREHAHSASTALAGRSTRS